MTNIKKWLDSDYAEQLRKSFEEVRAKNELSAENFWNNLSYEDKCNAFHAVVSKICKGEIEVEGSYRHVLYDIFGFDSDMYGRGMDCGFMTLHNSIMTKRQYDAESADDVDDDVDA